MSTRFPSGAIEHHGAAAASPVLLAVPHAGRDYPPALDAMLAVPRARLEALEDRHADLLVADAVAAGAGALVARRARAWIDLNRAEDEVDAGMIAPPPAGARASAKVRGGLGLVPRRLQGVGELWRGRLPAAALERRIGEDHRPWHAAIAARLAVARARFGAALLIDLHSMPPLTERHGAPDIVIGDRDGRSADPTLVAALCGAAREAGFTVARNHPYAGGHTLERHGRPIDGVHAVQIEIDRALYLAPGLRDPGPGVARMRTLVALLAARGAAWALREGELPLAAE